MDSMSESGSTLPTGGTGHAPPAAPLMPGPVALSANSIEILTEEFRAVVRQEMLAVGLGPIKGAEIQSRWSGGEMVLKPGKDGLQERSIPVEQFFRKIVNAREQLRNLEREINNHPKLDDSDRLELQQYLTRIYGSFTTFNALFAERSDWFVGQSGKR